MKVNWQENWDTILAVLPNGDVGFYNKSVKEHLKNTRKGICSINYSHMKRNRLLSFSVKNFNNFHTAAPLICQLELTNKCNLICSHCYAQSGPRAKRASELSTDEIFKLIDELDEMGTLSVFLTGGEVFTHPNSIEIINYANKKNFINQIFTNGLLITESLIKKILSPTIFAVSFDTALEDHTIRGGMNYKILSKKVKLLKEYGHTVRLSLSVHRENLNEIPEVYRWCYENDLPMPQWVETLPVGRALKNQHIMLRLSDMEKSKKIYYECMAFERKAQKDSNYKKVGLISFCTQIEQATQQEKCGRTFAYINSSGDVYPCSNCMSNCVYKASNIRKESFKNIWNNKFSDMRRVKYKDFKDCPNCPVEKAGIWCQFKCPPLSKNVSGDETSCGATEYLKKFMLFAYSISSKKSVL